MKRRTADRIALDKIAAVIEALPAKGAFEYVMAADDAVDQIKTILKDGKP